MSKTSKKVQRKAIQKGKKAAKRVAARTAKSVPRRSAKAARPKVQTRGRAVASKAIKVEKAARREPKEVEKAAQNKHNCNMKVVGEMLDSSVLVDFLSKNVGRHAMDIIKSLNQPKTDDKLAGDLNIKVNEVRRVLNVLDGYGVTRYDTHKNAKGWLTFNWYVDTSKLTELNGKLAAQGMESRFKLQEDCNDFFFCDKCYKTEKIIMPFDTAMERSFKCDCGSSLKRLSKEEAADLFKA